VIARHDAADETSNSSGLHTPARPLNSGGAPTLIMGRPLATVNVCAPRRHCVADENLNAFPMLMSLPSIQGSAASVEDRSSESIGGGSE
jgi:hypothetical protein